MNLIRHCLAFSLLLLIGFGCGPSFDLRKAERLMEKGNWGEADEILDRIASTHNGSEWGQKALMLKGCAFFKRARLDEAERALVDAREMMPEGEWADDCDYYLARVFFKRGDRIRAAEGFRRVLRDYGDDPDRSNRKLRAMEELEYLEKVREHEDG